MDVCPGLAGNIPSVGPENPASNSDLPFHPPIFTFEPTPCYTFSFPILPVILSIVSFTIPHSSGMAVTTTSPR